MTGAGPWQEYLDAARALQDLRDQHADVAAASTRTASAARAELTRVRAHLAQQRARLPSEPGNSRSPAARTGVESPMAGDPAAVHEALRQCRSLLAEIDAALASQPSLPDPPARRRRRPPRRWLVAMSAGAVLLATVAAIGLLVGFPF